MRKNNSDKNINSASSVVERHQILFHKMFNSNIADVDDMINQQEENIRIHKKFVDVGNQCSDFIRDSLVEIIAFINHKTNIPINSKKNKQYYVKEYNKPCAICGEKKSNKYG